MRPSVRSFLAGVAVTAAVVAGVAATSDDIGNLKAAVFGSGQIAPTAIETGVEWAVGEVEYRQARETGAREAALAQCEAWKDDAPPNWRELLHPDLEIPSFVVYGPVDIGEGDGLEKGCWMLFDNNRAEGVHWALACPTPVGYNTPLVRLDYSTEAEQKARIRHWFRLTDSECVPSDWPDAPVTPYPLLSAPTGD